MVEGKTGEGRRRRPRRKSYQCHCCGKELPYCMNCMCGFQICGDCFEENKWGLTNGPTWVCPDCGRVRMTY